MDSEEEVERFLWSLCQGFSGEGWTAWKNDECDMKLIEIRMTLKYHVDSDMYDRNCGKRRRGDMKSCMKTVPVNKKHCHHHR